MAYRVDYGSPKPREGTGGGRMLRVQFMTAVFLLIFTLLVSRMWPEGADRLKEVLVPGEDAVQIAFQEFVSELHAGEPLSDSLTVFCRQIIEHGQQN